MPSVYARSGETTWQSTRFERIGRYIDPQTKQLAKLPRWLNDANLRDFLKNECEVFEPELHVAEGVHVVYYLVVRDRYFETVCSTKKHGHAPSHFQKFKDMLDMPKTVLKIDG